MTYVQWKLQGLITQSYIARMGEAKLVVMRDMGSDRFYWAVEWPGKKATRFTHFDDTIRFTEAKPPVRVGGTADSVESAKKAAQERASKGRP